MAPRTPKKYAVKASVTKELLNQIDEEVFESGFNGRGDFAQYCMRLYFENKKHYKSIQAETALLTLKEAQRPEDRIEE